MSRLEALRTRPDDVRLLHHFRILHPSEGGYYGPMGRVGKYREGKYTDETESVAVDERPE